MNHFFNLNYFSWILLIMYIHILCCKVYNIIVNAFEFNTIKKFYNEDLHIEDYDLSDLQNGKKLLKNLKIFTTMKI